VPLSEDKTTEPDARSRDETRSVAVFDARQIITNKEWKGLVCTVIRVERTVHRRQTKTGLWKTSRETSYYLSNRPITAQDANTAIQDHWSIENSNHHVRDVTFREDDSRIRNKPGIFATLRSFAANILRFNQRKSIRQDRFACACGGLKFLAKLKFK
jgi:predicted transposase YbfD/YdcC